MPFSAGVFSRAYSWVTDAANALPISSFRMDADTNDIASGLSKCLLKDGTQTVTANIPMAGFILTGMGNGSVPSDSASVSNCQNYLMGGRLNLGGTPYLTGSVTAAGTIYYTPAVSPFVSLPSSFSVIPFYFLSTSQALSDTTKSPAAAAANKVYDMFVWMDTGSFVRCTRGPAWSSLTSRGAGAGTSELVYTNGLYTNASAITNGPGAELGVYVGSIATNGSALVDMNFGAAAGAAGGEANMLGVWNLYNRVPFTAYNFDNTNSWTYTSATWRTKNNNANNAISFVCGVDGTHYSARNLMHAGATASILPAICLSYDDNTFGTVYGERAQCSPSSAASFLSMGANLDGLSTPGLHTIYAGEYSGGGATSTFYGDNGTTAMQSKMSLRLFM